MGLTLRWTVLSERKARSMVEAGGVDRELEVLGALVLVEHLADAPADVGGARKRAAPDHGLHFRELHFRAPGRKSSSGTPKLFSAQDTMLYWPMVNTTSTICSVEYVFDRIAHVGSDTTEFS